MLSNNQIEKIHYFNSELVKLEQRIFNLSRQYEKEIQQNIKNSTYDIDDYEIDLEICFCAGPKELASWFEGLKSDLRDFRVLSYREIADGNNHNVAIEAELKGQHHCWFLHRLYDDYCLSWDDILMIDNIWYDIVIHYQYILDLQFNDINTLNNILFTLESKTITFEKQLNQMMRKKVLEGENGIIDYELEEEISFYMGREREFVPLHEKIKFFALLTKRADDWRELDNESWLLNSLQEELGGFDLSENEILQISSVFIDIVVREQYRVNLN